MAGCWRFKRGRKGWIAGFLVAGSFGEKQGSGVVRGKGGAGTGKEGGGEMKMKMKWKYFGAFLPFLLCQLYFSRCLTEVAMERSIF
jgi:hypothetical protein